MTVNNKTLYEKAMINPGKYFDTPAGLSADRRFSLDQKLNILESWAEDARALLRAEAENMESTSKKAQAAGLLELINKAEIEMNASH